MSAKDVNKKALSFANTSLYFKLIPKNNLIKI